MSSMRLVGRQLGRFRLDTFIGAGSTGAVYQAYDLDFGRVVALKVIDSAQAADFHTHLLPRVRAAAACDHPAIARIYDILTTPTATAVAADFASERLDNYLAGAGAGRWERRLSELLRLLAQAAEALDHAHRRGLLHGCLKPNNILLKPIDRPYNAGDPPLQTILTDFGLFRPQEWDVQSEPFLQTLRYLAPEQCHPDGRRPGEARSDIYSLGAVLYHLVTGRPPFADRSYAEAVYRSSEAPADPTALEPRLPQAVAAVIRQTLAPEPAQRPADGRKLAMALRAAAAGRAAAPLLVHPDSAPVEAAQEAPPLPLPADEALELVLSPQVVTLEPGEQAGVQLTLYNRSSRVGKFNLQVAGLPAEWASLSAGTAQLLPQAGHTLTLTLRPPRRSQAGAGSHAFQVIATDVSQPDGAAGAAVTGRLTLTPFTRLAVTLRPVYLRHKGVCNLVVRNDGNLPAAYRVEGRDPAGALQFGYERQAGELAPGEEAHVAVDIAPRRPRPLIGQVEMLPFALQVGAGGAEPVVKEGQVELRPYLPAWLIGLALPLLLMGCVLLGLLLAVNFAF